MIALQYMRMSCDSTYLLDRKTDFGVKADELVVLLEETFENPDTKVVVFSQWLGMHEVTRRRFEERGWDHVLFHGDLAVPQRKALLDRFREDAGCRVFLATDAAGVGLNLQHASVVVNLDLPWNPAVLEQRIGRVHRLGQRRPVRAINFVAQGTIEEGMLGLLGFKKSLFAGVLDGGEKEVFLGGTRLNRFMNSVEKATTAIPEATLEECSETPTPATPEEIAPAVARPRAVDPWASLLERGAELLGQLAMATGSLPPSAASTTARPGLSLVDRDERTGQAYLRVPMPPPEVLDKALQSIGLLLEHLTSQTAHADDPGLRRASARGQARPASGGR
jgi:hypothetical protein